MTVIDLQSQFRNELIAIIPRLRRFAYGLTGSRSDGDDLVQETLERALKRKHQFRGNNGLQGWVFSILRSSWKNELRSRRVRRGNGTVDVEELRDQSTHACPETQRLRQELHCRVLSLPENFRSVILLVDVEGLSYTEAAEVLDIPRGTLMSRLSRGREKLLDNPVGAIYTNE